MKVTSSLLNEGFAKTASKAFSSLAGDIHLSTVALGRFIGVAAGISLVVNAISAYRKHIEELVSSARESGEAWESSSKSLQEHIDRITELRTQLASGTLTEEEAYTAKAELLDIQQQLSDSYGSQVEGINLVNGSLKDQIALLNQVSQSEAQRYLNENREGIATAEKEMSKALGSNWIGNLAGYAGYYLGEYSNNGSQEAERINDIIDKYTDFLNVVEDTNGMKTIYFKGNAEDAHDVLNNLLTDVSQAEKDIGETNIFSNIQSNAEAGLSEANEILEKYQDIAEQAEEARLVANPELFSYGGKSQTAAKWLEDYAKAISDYNDALQSGDASKIDAAKKSFDEMNSAMANLMFSTGMNEYVAQVQELRNQLDETAIEANNFYNALAGNGKSSRDKAIKSIADVVKGFNLSDVDFESMAVSGDTSVAGNTVSIIASEAEKAGISLDSLIPMLVEIGVLSKGVSESFDGISESSEDAKSSFAEIISSEDFTNSLKDFQSNVSTIQAAIDSLNKGEEADALSLLQEFPKLSGKLDNTTDALQGLSDVKFDALSEELASVIKEIENLADPSEATKINDLIRHILADVDLTDINIGDLRSSVIRRALSGITNSRSIREITSFVVDTFDNIEIPSIKFDIDKESVSTLLSEISDIQSVLSSQKAGSSLSLDSYNAESLKDYRSALEYVNGSIQLNIDKVNDLVHAKSQEELQTIAVNKANSKTKYLENARQIEALRNKLRDNNNLMGDSRRSIENQIASLLHENSILADNCSQYDIMARSIENATSAYQHWINAQSAEKKGTMFTETMNAFNLIDDTLNNPKSDSYRRIGEADYKAAIDLVIPESIDREDESAINSYLDSLDKIFKMEDGKRVGSDIGNILKRAVDAGLMEVDGDEFKVAGEMTVEKFAEGMAMTVDEARAIISELESVGANFEWADDGAKDIESLGMAAYEAAESLREIDGNSDLRISMDVSDFKKKELAIETLDQTINEMNTLKAKPGIDTSQIESANAIIQYCVAQKQELNAPVVMSVDTSQVQGELGIALDLLQKFQTAKNNVEMQASINADTTEAQNEVDSLTEKIEGLSPEIKATLGIEEGSLTAESISATIGQLTIPDMIKAGVDESLVEDFMKEDHDVEAKAVYIVDDKNVKKYNPSDKNAYVNYRAKFIETKVPELHGTVTYVRKYIGSTPAVQVNGTAHVSGTANANGNWGTAKGGKTLVGELGRENFATAYGDICIAII